MGPKVLILGGTEQARQLAEALQGTMAVTTSLAGRTAKPGPIAGALRVGGFGGVAGLKRYLVERQIQALVDATHPYAERMGLNAIAAAQGARVPLLRLERAPWMPESDDVWYSYCTVTAIANALPSLGKKRVFLSLGGADLSAFTHVPNIRFTIRAIDPPKAFHDRDDVEILLARGPFDLAAETDLLSTRAIDLVVSRNAGGKGVWPKIEAARLLGIPVAMIARPTRTGTNPVYDVARAVEWVQEKVWIE